MDNLVRSGSRQVVGHAGREGMPDVKVRIAAVYVRITDRCGRVQVGRKCVCRGNVNRVGERIRRQSLQPSRQTTLELKLQSLVVRSRRIVGDSDKLKIWIGIKQIGHSKQVATNRTDV